MALIALLLATFCWQFVLSSVANTPSYPAFAAKKKAKRKSSTSTSSKGFGASPAQVLADTVATFRTRLPENAAELPCPCGFSDSPYKDCCQPFHKGDRFPDTPTQILQSRYSAFVYRLIPYILETTHPTCRDWRPNQVSWAKDLNRAGMFDSYDFVALEDVSPEDPPVSGDDNDARSEVYVSFKVRMRAKATLSAAAGDTLEGQETVVSERSLFLRDDDGTWKYASGEVKSEIRGLEDAVLNP